MKYKRADTILFHVTIHYSTFVHQFHKVIHYRNFLDNYHALLKVMFLKILNE